MLFRSDYELTIDCAKDICLSSLSNKKLLAVNYLYLVEQQRKNYNSLKNNLLLKLYSDDSLEVDIAYQKLLELDKQPKVKSITERRNCGYNVKGDGYDTEED